MSGLSVLFLAIAILAEVGATLSLRMATHGSRLWIIPVAIGYPIAFAMLVLTLAEGVPLGVTYGIWTAAGVALTAVAGRVLFKEPFTWLMAAGVALIIGGVLLVETGVQH
ncbi:SMR family transporter [Cnuibacter physcomitrellae]|uniref:DMT family transporter n=1 Tax=Cnuibacter physcomitrellae TaxID=1619308 RepID=UPI002175E20B|nr:SMR family transporter [Cnuibacter physcomitrellae]MCS5497160.1 SMR family transporter [Cnuibacter physcomitrellae]